jgi:predicted Zn-dependent peptidase/soluble lytic murein transglycosylase-like protein
MAPMKRRGRRTALFVAGAVGLSAALGLSASPRVRASFSAAYRAFRDPTLIDHNAPAPVAPVAANGPVIDEGRALDAAIARDFEKASDDDLDDPEGATLATLALPDLRIPVTRRTMRFVRFFARNDGGRIVFAERFQRSGRYRPLIEHALREAGLPEDLVWLAGIESGFDPRAVSQAGAAGLFQFMPETGSVYGLDQSSWVDDRRSLKRATTAAVAHLRDLYERFGRWDLSLAAYNAGVESVLRAMQRYAESRGPGFSGTITFADLAQAKLLPEETANYVPQIVAYALVAANRARFGLDNVQADPPLQMGEIAVPEGTRLKTIARAAGIPTRLLREYNPELLRDRVPPFGGDYIINLPAERLQQTLASFPAYLEHERVDDPGADPAAESATAMAAPKIEIGDVDEDDGPLPPRPSPLGRNRLPEFVLPGQSAPAGLSLAGFGPLGPRLPSVTLGGDLGWQRPRSNDPLALLVEGQKPSPQAAAKALGGKALERELGFIPAPAKVELPRDPFERFVLPNGIVVRVREDASAPRVAITVRIAPDEMAHAAEGDVAGVHDAPGELGTGELRHTVTVSKRDVDLGLSLAAGRLRMWLSETSAAQLAGLRRQATMPLRQQLASQPYGPSWLALGDALFPEGHPLAGRVIGARDDAVVAQDLFLTEAMAEERVPGRASITLIGDVSRERVQTLSGRLLGVLPPAVEAPIGPHPREERIALERPVPSPRILMGWIAPGEEDVAQHAAMRAAMWILSSTKGGRLDRGLKETGFAAEVKTVLDAGSRASVAAIEVIPAVPHEVPEVEQKLDELLAALTGAGPTGAEVAAAAAHLKAGLKKELASTKGVVAENAPKAANSARLREAMSPGGVQALMKELDKLTPQAVRNAARKTLMKTQRVVVVTAPKQG